MCGRKYLSAVELYNYKAVCTRVIDGDTIVCDISLGFFTSIIAQRIRLSRINAPELNTEKGKEAREYLKEIIEGKEIILKTKKGRGQKDKYGRWLGEIYCDTENINNLMVYQKLAVYY